MIDFNYFAKTKNGEVVKGAVEADSESSAAKVLISRDLFPVSIVKTEKKGITLFSRIGTKDKVFLMRQLATTINAGLPISQALETLQNQTGNKKLRDLIVSISNDVEAGVSLSQAFANFPKIFSQIDITLVQTGETTGTLDKALGRLATQMENDYRLTKKIRGALIYPAFIAVVVVVVVAIMMIYVVPQMKGLYDSFGANLPLMTRIVVAMSTSITSYGVLMVILIAAAVFGVRAFIRTKQGRYFWDGLKLKLPLVNTLIRAVYLARFTRTLSGLVAAGVSVLEALDIVSRAVGNVLYEDTIAASITQVKSGVPLSTPLRESALFPPIVSQMVRVGEQTGEIDGMLSNLADYYEEEVDNLVKNITSIMEPIMIVVMGGIVGFILISVMMPIYGLGKVIK